MTVTDPTYLEVGHLAAFAPDPGTAVHHHKRRASLTDFAYGDSTGYLTLPEGTYDVAVGRLAAPLQLIDTVILAPGTHYTASHRHGVNHH
jgi:hypothetical protein